jgi:redox-sensitive bicupin YhaK (pirin superfamily)
MPEDFIIQTITPTSHNLGDFRVHRALPARERTMVGPFIFFDQAGPALIGPGQGVDVRPHPHINLATVTYMYEGAFVHRDSLGTEQLIEPGAVNLMTAGKGIVHSERSPDAERARASRLSAIQTWLALPDRDEEMDPAFEHVGEDRLPIVDCGQARARVIMGTLWGRSAPVTTYAGTIYADIQLSAAACPSIRRRTNGRSMSRAAARRSTACCSSRRPSMCCAPASAPR